jgi:tRNA-dihydrouridine synthase B
MTKVADTRCGSRLAWFGGGQFPLYLAPMAGFTDRAFRQLCKEQGADVMVTEFVMADKFLDPRGEHLAWETVDFTESQRPMGVQVFGGNPEKMAEAADRISDRLKPDFVDINYGCPAPRVVNNCAGSSLLRQPALLAEVARAVVARAADRAPVTAKIRIGWDRDSINAVDNARRLEDAGIEALAVHGRTKEQGYQGEADWDVIHAVADAVKIPVIGNGGIRTAEDVRRVRAANKVRGLMLGRAALGNPWIFREIKHALATGEALPSPTIAERWAMMIRYCEELTAHHSRAEPDRINWMRARLKAFAREFPGSKAMRRELEQVGSADELRRLASRYRTR